MNGEIDRRASEWGVAILGDATRVRILQTIGRKGAMSVTSVAEAAGTPVVNASHHLRLLNANGVLDFEKRGRQVFYDLVEGTTVDSEAIVFEHPSGVVISLPLGN